MIYSFFHSYSNRFFLSFTLDNKVLQCRAGGGGSNPRSSEVIRSGCQPRPTTAHTSSRSLFHTRLHHIVAGFPPCGCRSFPAAIRQGYCGRALRYGVPVFPGCQLCSRRAWRWRMGCRSFPAVIGRSFPAAIPTHSTTAVRYISGSRPSKLPAGAVLPQVIGLRPLGSAGSYMKCSGVPPSFCPFRLPLLRDCRGGGFSSGRATRQF